MTTQVQSTRDKHRRVRVEPSQVVHALRARMEELGWTQKRLAEESGVQQSQVSATFRGWSEPSLMTVERLASALGMRLTLTFYGGMT